MPTPSNKKPFSPKEIASVSTEIFIERTLEYASHHHGCIQAKLLAESAVLHFAQKRWQDYCADEVRKKLHDYDLLKNLEIPIDQVSVVTACMNRNDHLATSLASWVATDRFSEIIIVDFGSDTPVMDTLLKANLLRDDRIRIIRVEASKWCLAEAFNIGLFESKSVFTFKLDADTIIPSNVDLSLRLSAKQFKSGNWRTFKNNYLNGIVLAPTEAIRRAGGYNEQIRRYGWDDCDFYSRLSDLGFTKVDLEENEFISIEHTNQLRLQHSDEIAINTNINILIHGNRLLATLLPKWTDKCKRQFQFPNLKNESKNKFLEISELAYSLSSIHFNFLYASDKFLYEDVLDEIHTAIFHSDVLGIYRLNCQNLLQELSKSRIDYANVEGELAEYQLNCQNLQEELSESRKDYANVQHELEEYRLNCKNLQEELSESRKDCANVQSELSESRKDCANVQSELSKTIHHYNLLNFEFGDLFNKLHKMQNKKWVKLGSKLKICKFKPVESPRNFEKKK